MFSACVGSGERSDRERLMKAVDAVPSVSTIKMATNSQAETTSRTSNSSPTSVAVDFDDPAELGEEVNDVPNFLSSLLGGNKQKADLPSHVTTTKIPSILKKTNDDMYIKDSKRVWKNLPKPEKLSRSLSVPNLSKLESKPSGKAKQVSFDSIRIRNYEQTLGDNPSVSYGPPISLDWMYQETEPVALEVYEAERVPRRKLRQMMLNYFHRTSILTHKAGHSEQELKEAEKRANRVKRERAITRTMLPACKVEEVIESAARKMKRMGKPKRHTTV